MTATDETTNTTTATTTPDTPSADAPTTPSPGASSPASPPPVAARPPSRLRARVFVTLVLLLAAAAYLGRVAFWRPLPLVGSAPDDGYVRVAGSLHIHTTLSDGGGTPAEVLAAARREGLGFVIITDHNNLGAKPLEGYHDGLPEPVGTGTSTRSQFNRVLTIVGTEISNREGHIIGIGLRDPHYCFSADARDALDDIHHLGGYPIVAHPLMAAGSLTDEHGWSGWDLPGPWGFELINGKGLWRDASWPRRLRMLGLYPFNSRYALLSLATRPEAALERWDELLKRRDVTGTLGADAHSRLPLTRRRSVRFPSYDVLLGVARTHVLLSQPLAGDASRDIPAVVEALAHGRSYIAYDALAPADDFSFTAEVLMADVPQPHLTMGDTVVLAPAGLPAGAKPTVNLRVAGRMPAGAQVRLLWDGHLIAKGPAPLVALADHAGVYRCEVDVPGWDTPWVISNPIVVVENEQQAAERAARAAWPKEEELPPVATLLDSFGPETGFAPEFDPISEMEQPAFDPHAGIDGGPAAKLAFRLAPPTPAQPYTWCALASRKPRDLSDTKGLTFWIRGDGEYRIWVQVRDENPASEDEQTEWWFASVRTSTEWRRVIVPYERLFSLNKHSDGRLDLDRVRAIIFVLDYRAVWPGTRGTIWIDELGTYR